MDDEAIEQARQGLQDAWQRLADATKEATDRHHVIVNIFKIGLDCSKCSGPWDGFWEHYETRVCRACGDAVLSEVMGTIAAPE